MIFEEKRHLSEWTRMKMKRKISRYLNEIPPKDRLKTIKNHPKKNYPPIAFGSEIRRILPRRI